MSAGWLEPHGKSIFHWVWNFQQYPILAIVFARELGDTSAVRRLRQMIEADVVRLMREHLESQFPKVCPTCHFRYEDLRQYIFITERIEPSVCYDAEIEDWTPRQPIGTATYSNCRCGTTLALSSHGMPVLRLWALYHWARGEKKRRGITMPELLSYLRDQIRQQVLAEPPKGKSKDIP